MTENSTTALYAEYLPKLGRVSVVLHLPSPATDDTQIRLSPDGLRFHVHHERSDYELALPVKTLPLLPGGAVGTKIPRGLAKMSWRLVADRPHSASPATIGEDAVVPWSAVDLRPNLDVVCRSCTTVVVPRDRVGQWKDLPSENWAEMMEFWHCHKPVAHKNGHHDHDHAHAHDRIEAAQLSDAQLASRGYGANSSIMAQQAVGFVDLTKLLFHVEDCLSLEVNSQTSSSLPLEEYLASLNTQDQDNYTTATATGTNPVVACANCHAQLGCFESRKWGIALFKWKLDLVGGDGSGEPLPSAPTLSHCLAAALIATQARCGTAKVVLQGTSTEEAITVWILNPYVRFSCQAKQQATTAMKLLFQNKAMDEEEEEIFLPDEVVREARAILEAGNEYLPPGDKTTLFRPDEGPWTVSMLERVER